MLIPFTLGLIFPYIVYRKKKYVFDHIAYGTTRSTFNRSPRAFYYIYLAIFGFSILGLAIFVALSGMLGSIFSEPRSENPTAIMTSIALGLGYLGFIFVASLVQQYIYTKSSNYCWNHSTLGHVRFHSTLKTWPLVRIRITNLLAIICSLGLLIPWARIRRTRYILDHIQLMVAGDLDHFTADQGTEDHALGDVSADFFDIEVGL